MGKIAKAIGMDMPMGGDKESPEEDATESEEESTDEAGGAAGELAMKQFSRATSPKEKASAMYDFMQACGVC